MAYNSPQGAFNTPPLRASYSAEGGPPGYGGAPGYGGPPPNEPLFTFGWAPQAGGYLPCFKQADRLHSESVDGPQTLREGQMLYSANGQFYLTIRNNGELAVCWAENHRQLWANPKGWFSQKGEPPFSLVMQGDSNLVIYDGAHRPMWSSKTANARRGQTSFVAIMQSDRNFVIYDMNNFVVWSAGSNKT